jgi:hypothetical protein
MQCIFITVLLVVVSLNITTTAADCIERDVIVGTGYNLIFGNPQANKPEDPGLRRTHQILQLTYDEPKEVIIVPMTSFAYEEHTQFIAGTRSYRNELELNVKVSGGADFGLSSFSFSMSNDYKKIEKSTSSSRYVYFDKEAYCYISTQRYKMANIASMRDYGVTQEFFNEVILLPTKKPKVNGTGNELAYYELLTNWGTHIIVKANLGGRYLERTVSTLQKLYKFAEQTDKSSISTSGSYMGYSSSLDLDLNTLNSKTSSNTTFGEKKEIFSVGSKIQKVDGKWVVPDGDTSAPEPAVIHLESIDKVCSHNGYWDKYTPKLKITADPLKTICSNLRYALKTYAEYLKLKRKPDNLKIPLTWPDGTYGFPKANSGCPDDAKNSPMEFGYLTTWDRTKVNTLNHLAGWNDKARFEFCTKSTYYESEDYHFSKFGKGNYCLYKFGTCPSGFTVGYVQDFMIFSRKAFSTGGTLPDGQYSGMSWNIQYCCRKDAHSFTKPMILPNHRPFYLIRIGGYCQYVKGMKVNKTGEFVKWKNLLIDFVKTGGLHPDVEVTKHYRKIFFCYYH